MLYHVIILHLITPHDLAQTAQTPHILLFVHYIHCTYTLRNPNPNTEAMNDCNVIKLMLFDRCIQNFKCEEDDEYQETLTSMEVKRGEGVKAFNVSCLCNTEQSPEARVTTIVLNNHVKDVKITHGHIRKHRKYDQKIKS